MQEATLDGKRVNLTSVQLIKEDITDLEVEAFVFYAQPDLVVGSGFGTAISVRGGASIQKELHELAPVQTGQAVVSAAGDLKADFIIHAVGPRFQEENIEDKLRTTVLNSLKAAEEKGIERIAFPAMGAGYYGIAPDICARVMLGEIKSYLEGRTGIKELIICVVDAVQYEAFYAQLATLH